MTNAMGLDIEISVFYHILRNCSATLIAWYGHA